MEEKVGEVGDVSEDDQKYDEEQMLDRDEELCRARVCVDPLRPTKEEVDQHNLTCHAQYRSWRPHCVRGRGQSSPHQQSRRDTKAEETEKG